MCSAVPADMLQHITMMSALGLITDTDHYTGSEVNYKRIWIRQVRKVESSFDLFSQKHKNADRRPASGLALPKNVLGI